jgi:ABC-type transport system involved in cytochrome c biogenesis permease subunit
MDSDLTQALTPRKRRNPIVRLLSSIWFGIALLVLILIYSSIISAFPPVRWALEMTDMQAYRHWVFVTLSILFMVSLVAATVLRTRWLPINAGALVAHIGLLVLLFGALAYFGSKVEGHVLLRSPVVEVQAGMGGSPTTIARFRAVEGENWARRLPPDNRAVQIEVLDVETDGVELAQATVGMQVGDNQPSALVLPAEGQQWQAAGDGLRMRLVTFPSKSAFYHSQIPALYIRDVKAGQERMADVPGLPIYREHYLVEGKLLEDSNGNPVPPNREYPYLPLGGLKIPTGWFERWRMPIDVDTEGLPFTLRITGYVPYVAGFRPEQAEDGAPRDVPVLAAKGQRRMDISSRAMSAIRMEFRGRGEQSDWQLTRWCMFSLYPDVDARPLEFIMPGSDTVWQFIYSNRRYDLGATVAARNLSVEFFPGQRGIQSWHSNIMLREGDGAARRVTVETNNTVSVGQWTLFQSGFAPDRWSYTILGVGNRVGMLPMNVGWILVTLGCLYAFYAKPVLLRRLKRRYATVGTAAALLLLVLLPACRKPAEPYQASQQAAALDQKIDWTDARLVAVQEGGRYKTLDSFARESLSAMAGSEHFPGLSPLASLFEWLFNREAYTDTPLIKVRNSGIRARLVQQMSEDKRQRIMESKRFTPRELADPTIEQLLRQMESDPMKRNAVNRVRTAQAYARRLQEFVAVVPQPGGDEVAPWFTPDEVLANLSDEQLSQLGLSRRDLPAGSRDPVPGVMPDQALKVTVAWTSLRAAWLGGDAERVQQYVTRLAEYLPQLAEPGVYPERSQRAAEARYYAAGKFTYGWVFYFLALLVSILALVTGWRAPWVITMILLLPALGVHAYGLGLRWYILDRIPVANIFEAVVASAAIGIGIALLVELFQRTRVLLVGACATGFMALVAGQFVLPGSELNIIPAILDDIQLRLHTVMIITAYALSFLGAVVAFVYLLGYYGVKVRRVTVAAVNGGAPVPVTAGISTERPILAGASPGDEGRSENLPQWLNNIDWSHLIILNMVFVLLFVGGVILGAWWADYSWGRPWGWDPKEVFALNTWIIYAILIHIRFVVKNRGVWTAWLSILGCGMMAFNWFFVNFFIASVHSYA